MVQRRVRKSAESYAQGISRSRGSTSEQRRAEKASKGRGPDAHIPPRPANKRPTLTIGGHRAFRSSPPDHGISKIISQLIRNCYPGPCESYKTYPDATKKVIMKEFLEYFRWDNNINHVKALEVFTRIADKRLQDMLCKARGEALELFKTANYQVWKERGPPSTYAWIKKDNWIKLCDNWSTKKFQDISHRNSKNRLASGDNSFSTTGSISMLAHKQRMEEKMAREPRFLELFEATHKNKKGEFCSERAKGVIYKYDELMVDKYGEDHSTHPDFDAALWNEAIGGNLHGDNYGFGDLGLTRSIYRPNQPDGNPTSSSNDMNVDVDPKILEMVTNQVKSLKKTMKKKIVKKMKKKMNKKIKQLEMKVWRKLATSQSSFEVGLSATRRPRKEVCVETNSATRCPENEVCTVDTSSATHRQGKKVCVETSSDESSSSSDESDSDSDSDSDSGYDVDSESRVLESSHI